MLRRLDNRKSSPLPSMSDFEPVGQTKPLKLLKAGTPPGPTNLYLFTLICLLFLTYCPNHWKPFGRLCSRFVLLASPTLRWQVAPGLPRACIARPR